MLKGLVKRLKREHSPARTHIQPTIIPRAEHSISRNDINPNALKVLYRLHNNGYKAYLVGGCVRDLLLKRRPKDFDIATNAHPDEIRQLFKNCRLIGKRFRLAHILFGKDIIEVATFRAHHENAEQEHGKTHQGMIVRDNVYGTIEDDAWRRDFTVNGLYYNIADFSVVDYVNGIQDIQSTTLRIIGNPEKRYQEDPVRMLRAMRFMGKLNLTISPETEKPILEMHSLLHKVSPARLYLEVMKLLQEGATLPTFRLLQKYSLLEELFPILNLHFKKPEVTLLIETALESADNRVKEFKTVSPAFIFAVFIWPSVADNLKKLADAQLPLFVAYEKAINEAAKELTERLAIPRNLTIIVREICSLQFRLTQRFGTRPYRLLNHPRFRAAYDLLILRSKTGEPLQELSEWWTSFNEANDQQRDVLLKTIEKSTPFKRKKRKKKKHHNA